MCALGSRAGWLPFPWLPRGQIQPERLVRGWIQTRGARRIGFVTRADKSQCFLCMWPCLADRIGSSIGQVCQYRAAPSKGLGARRASHAPVSEAISSRSRQGDMGAVIPSALCSGLHRFRDSRKKGISHCTFELTNDKKG